MIDRFLEHQRETLAWFTFLNTVANFGVAFLALWMVLERHANEMHWVLISLAMLVVGCEICPKTLATRHPDTWSLRVAPILGVMLLFVVPLRNIRKVITRFAIEEPVVLGDFVEIPRLPTDEYIELLDLACQQGAMSLEEKNFIVRIISLDSRTAKESMKLRSQMAYIWPNASTKDMIRVARKFKHRRLPVYDVVMNSVDGILNTKVLLLDAEADPIEMFDVPNYVPEGMNLLQLLKSFQRLQPGIVVVLDEFGEVSGVITMEDILEEVVGDIRSESQEVGFIFEREDSSTWRVSGSLPIEDIVRECPEMKVPPYIQTVAGLLLSQLESVPEPGQSMLFCGYRLTAISVEFARIREVRIVRLSPKSKSRALARSTA